MEIAHVTETLRAADDASRFAVAQSIAQDASPQDLLAVAKLLVAEDRGVRLGAISVLRAASFRPATGALVAICKTRGGKERALALHALAELCTPDDKERLLPALAASKDDPGDDVREARDRLMALCAPREQLVEKVGATSSMFGLLAPDQNKRRAALVRTLKEHPNPGQVLAESLKETRNDGVRMDLIGGLGTLPPEKLADAVDVCCDGGDGDLLALLARMLGRKLTDQDAEVRLRVARRLLTAERSTDSLIAKEALRSASRALAPELAVVEQAREVATLETDELTALLDALAELGDDGRRAALEALVAGLAKVPARVGVFAEALFADLDALDVMAKTRLAAVCVQAAGATTDDEDLQRHLGPLARLYARVVLPGARLPRQLVVGLTLSPDDQDRFALVELCAAVQTEESAAELKKLFEGTASDAVKARARDALAGFESADVEVLLHPDDTAELLPRYKTPAGERLSADGRYLVSSDGERWVLTADGQPARVRNTSHGGCRCCFRPRALEVVEASEDDETGEGPARPTCPVTGKAHLLTDDDPVLLEGHPLGGCTVCESLRPLERQGERVSCPSCHTGYERDGDAWVPKTARPAAARYTYALEEGAPPRKSDVLPDIDDLNIIPPTEQDLDDLPDEVVRAMRANVVLYGKGGFKEWGGTGLIVARSEREIAILTARQNVEQTDGDEHGQRVPLTCVTIEGEVQKTRVVWVAQGGVDLALLAATVDGADALAEVDLAGGKNPKLGAPLFAVGNQLGFPWSYSSGSASGLRTLTTSGGLELRYVQTPMPLASGSGGGGLYLEGGELAGVVSWYRISGWSDATNFAISAESVAATLRREKVRFGGERLVDDD